jgi:hypothetical protein
MLPNIYDSYFSWSSLCTSIPGEACTDDGATAHKNNSTEAGENTEENKKRKNISEVFNS